MELAQNWQLKVTLQTQFLNCVKSSYKQVKHIIDPMTPLTANIIEEAAAWAVLRNNEPSKEIKRMEQLE